MDEYTKDLITYFHNSVSKFRKAYEEIAISVVSPEFYSELWKYGIVTIRPKILNLSEDVSLATIDQFIFTLIFNFSEKEKQDKIEVILRNDGLFDLYFTPKVEFYEDEYAYFEKFKEELGTGLTNSEVIRLIDKKYLEQK